MSEWDDKRLTTRKEVFLEWWHGLTEEDRNTVSDRAYWLLYEGFTVGVDWGGREDR